MSKKIVYEFFGNEDAPTIYYLVGHGGAIKQYRFHIRFLVRSGFRVMAFQYDPKVLVCGDPQRLMQVLTELLKAINHDRSNHETRGIYGVSLGTFLGLNIMAMTDITKGIFNTGPASLAEVVWEMPSFDTVKGAFVKNGYNRKDLEKAWKPIEMSTLAPKLKHADVICMNSRDDKIVTFSNSQEAERLLRGGGAKVRSITSRWLGHTGVIIRNSLRFKMVKKFFQ